MGLARERVWPTDLAHRSFDVALVAQVARHRRHPHVRRSLPSHRSIDAAHSRVVSHFRCFSVLLLSNGIGHSELLWFVRSVPAVREAFERVWHTDDLIVSFDGAGAFRPWQIDASWKSKGGWYHVDQNGLILPSMIAH